MFYTSSSNDLEHDLLPPDSRYCFPMIESSRSAGNLTLAKQVSSDYHNDGWKLINLLSSLLTKDDIFNIRLEI